MSSFYNKICRYTGQLFSFFRSKLLAVVAVLFYSMNPLVAEFFVV